MRAKVAQTVAMMRVQRLRGAMKGARAQTIAEAEAPMAAADTANLDASTWACGLALGRVCCRGRTTTAEQMLDIRVDRIGTREGPRLPLLC